MGDSLKDINALVNVGGTLTHWTGASSSGGELHEYDTSPIGGPPAGDYDADVRDKITIEITTKVIGADAAAREAFIDSFARGTVFSGKAAPSSSGEFGVTGEDVVGTDYTVVNRTVQHKEKDNSEITIMLKEKGPTPAP